MATATVQGVPQGLTEEDIQGVPSGLTAENISSGGSVKGVPEGLTEHELGDTSAHSTSPISKPQSLWDRASSEVQEIKNHPIAETARLAVTPLVPEGRAEKEGREFADSPPTLSQSDHPFVTGLKKSLAGTYADTLSTVRGFTSPVALATVGLGKLSEAPGAVGKIATTVGKLAGVGFAAQGGKQALEGLDEENNKEGGLTARGVVTNPKVLSGTGQAILGVTAPRVEREAVTPEVKQARGLGKIEVPQTNSDPFGIRPIRPLSEGTASPGASQGNQLPDIHKSVGLRSIRVPESLAPEAVEQVKTENSEAPASERAHSPEEASARADFKGRLNQLLPAGPATAQALEDHVFSLAKNPADVKILTDSNGKVVHGTNGVVYDIGSGKIAKITAGEAPSVISPDVNKPLSSKKVSGASQDYHVNTYQKLETDNIPQEAVKILTDKLRTQGLAWIDPSVENVGRTPRGTYKVIDAESVKKLPGYHGSMSMPEEPEPVVESKSEAKTELNPKAGEELSESEKRGLAHRIGEKAANDLSPAGQERAMRFLKVTNKQLSDFANEFGPDHPDGPAETWVPKDFARSGSKGLHPNKELVFQHIQNNVPHAQFMARSQDWGRTATEDK